MLNFNLAKNQREWRKATCALLEAAEQGVISWEGLAQSCLAYMSEADVADMARVYFDHVFKDENE